jgi:hypothetical protein
MSIPQPPISKKPSNKTDILLAISAIHTLQIPAVSRAAVTYNVVKSTLQNQHTRKLVQCNCQPNSKKLIKLEEEVIVRYILDLDQCGFEPTYVVVCDMADKLLAACSTGCVGIHWLCNFVKCTDSLAIRLNQAYNRQRALCKDPVLIRS